MASDVRIYISVVGVDSRYRQVSVARAGRRHADAAGRVLNGKNLI